MKVQSGWTSGLDERPVSRTDFPTTSAFFHSWKDFSLVEGLSIRGKLNPHVKNFFPFRGKGGWYDFLSRGIQKHVFVRTIVFYFKIRKKLLSDDLNVIELDGIQWLLRIASTASNTVLDVFGSIRTLKYQAWQGEKGLNTPPLPPPFLKRSPKALNTMPDYARETVRNDLNSFPIKKPRMIGAFFMH